jgi:hypothetical protein
MKASELKCSVCGKGIEVPLYRNGPVGISEVEWRCLEHVDAQYRPNEEMRELCEVISNDQPAESNYRSAGNVKQQAEPETRQYTNVWDY